MEKVCKGCGIAMNNRDRPNARYCTPECKRQHRLVRYEPRSCEYCQKQFVPKIKHQKRCSKQCARDFVQKTDEWDRYLFNYNMNRKYGITAEEYDSLHLNQNGLCAICNGTNAEMRLAVDHCHATGAIRGLLCNQCNRALGLFKDDTKLLSAVLLYLQQQRSAL